MTTALPQGLSPKYWSTYQLRGTIHESLESGEEWIASYDNVGLYEGNNKVASHQILSIHITTHRLILVPSASDPSAPSSSRGPPALQTNLLHVRQTEFYSGFMRSSAKITLFLGPKPRDGPSSPQTETGSGGGSGQISGEAVSADGASRSWTCGVCGMVNQLRSFEIVPSPASKCTLCGVTYASSRTSALPPSRTTTPAPPSPVTLSRTATPAPAANPQALSSPPQPPDAQGRIACPACTFLNHRSMSQCEICSTSLPRQGDRQNALRSTEPTPDKLDIARLSFRKGGEKDAYKKLKSVLSDKVWERSTAPPPSRARATAAAGDSAARPIADSGPIRPIAGIDGILQTMRLDSKVQDESMQSAFQDLEVLMVRAGEMVKLAQALDAKLTASQAAGNAPSEEEASLIRSSLVQLGLPTPALTSDMVQTEKEYHRGLARELGGLLTGTGRPGGTAEGVMTGKEGRGVLGLDEVWGLWMRARGVALLPPATLNTILPLLPDYTSPPISSLTLGSSLMVLYSPTYSPQNILNRLLRLLDPSAGSDGPASAENSLNVIEIAGHEGLSIGLATELMAEVERLGSAVTSGGSNGINGLVRDEQAEQGSGGVRWYRDLISAWAVESISASR